MAQKVLLQGTTAAGGTKIKKEVMIEENDIIELKNETKKGQRDSHTKTRNREKGPGAGKGTGELLFL